MRHFGDACTDLVVHGVDVYPPGVSKLRAHGGICHVLIAREHVRQHAHIARALYVILPANRADADGRAAEIAGQQRQARQAFHHIHGLAELGHAHAPHHRGRRRGGEGAHRLTHVARRDTGQMFDLLRRVIRNDFTIGVEAIGEARDVVFVVQLLFQQNVAKGIDQRHIAAVIEL
ncbi:hypothetical protein D3C72_1289170 [compost metagenome]